jgi:NADH-quinone oxidoreductase subunit N
MATHALDAVRTFMRGDGVVLLPQMELLLFAVGILLMDLWISHKDKYWNPALALAGTAFSGSTLWMLRTRIAATGDLAGFRETAVVDSYFLFFSALLLAATALLILLSINYPPIFASRKARYYALLLFACAGMMFMVCAVDLLVIYLAIEVAAISSYLLAAYPGRSRKPDPDSVRFLVSSAFGSAILAYGFSLLYGLSASTNIGKIAVALERRHNVAKVIASSRQAGAHGSQTYQLLLSRLPEALHWRPFILQTLPIAAFVLVLFGLLAKLKAAASHQYDGNASSAIPRTVALYLSGAFLTATFALLLRLTLTIFADSQGVWWYIVAALAVAMIVWGSFASLRQKSMERILAYSSLAHIGYLLLTLVSGNETALTAATYYLFTYLFISTGAFAVLLTVRYKGTVDRDQVNLHGLRQKSPLTALLLIIFVLSLSGVPPTAGFFARYFIFQSLLETGHHFLAWFSAFSALPLACSYLRVAIHAWRRDPEAETTPISFGVPQAIVFGACVFVSLAAGLYSEPFLRLARYAFGQ